MGRIALLLLSLLLVNCNFSEKLKLERKRKEIKSEIDRYLALFFQDYFPKSYTFQNEDLVNKYRGTVFVFKGCVMDITRNKNNSTYILHIENRYNVRCKLQTSLKDVNNIIRLENEGQLFFIFFAKIKDVSRIINFSIDLEDYDCDIDAIGDTELSDYSVGFLEEYFYVFNGELVDYKEGNGIYINDLKTFPNE